MKPDAYFGHPQFAEPWLVPIEAAPHDEPVCTHSSATRFDRPDQLPAARRRWVARCGLGLVIAAVLCSASRPIAGPLSGGPFTLLGSVGGGGISSGGAFSVSGWVASAGAGTSSGDEFDLTCGLVGAYVAGAEDPALKVELTAEGLVRIWWSPDLTGYHLESTTALGSGWSPVEPPPAGSSYFVEPAGPARFFRLRKS